MLTPMQWHHIKPTPIPVVSCDASGITLQKSCVALHFNFLNIRNVMLQLMMLVAAGDTGVSASRSRWPKSQVTSSFGLSGWRECSGAIFDVSGIMHYQHQYQWHHMTKKSLSTLFWSSWANTCSCTIDNPIGITWCQCQNQMHHMMKKVMLHLILIIFTKQMQWCHWWCHWHHMVLVPMASHDQ